MNCSLKLMLLLMISIGCSSNPLRNPSDVGFFDEDGSTSKADILSENDGAFSRDGSDTSMDLPVAPPDTLTHFSDAPVPPPIDLPSPSSDTWSDAPPADNPGTVFAMSIRQIEAIGDFTCVVTMGGEVYCWGVHRYIASPTGDPRRAQRIEGLRDIVQIALGYIQACALDRGGRVWCWGSNYVNSLGVGSSEILVRRPTLVPGVQNVTHVAVYGSGSGAQYARSTDGAVYVWGQGVSPPRRVVVPGVPLDVRSRYSTLCMRLMGGGYACIGVRSPDGQVIGSRPPTRDDPWLVSGTQDFTALEGIVDFWCGLRSDRSVSCWGANRVAQLGIAPEMSDVCQQPCIATLPPCTETYRCLRTARQVSSLTDVEEIALGDETSCARRRDGSVWCWGGAFTWGDGPDFITYGDGVMNGELCPATLYTPFTTLKNFDPRPCRRAPVPITGLSGVTALAVGSRHACALLASGQVWCWGVNRSGQLGDATIINRPTPVPVRF